MIGIKNMFDGRIFFDAAILCRSLAKLGGSWFYISSIDKQMISI